MFDATPLKPGLATLLVAPTTTRTLSPASAEVSVNVVLVASVGMFSTIEHELAEEHSCHS